MGARRGRGAGFWPLLARGQVPVLGQHVMPGQRMEARGFQLGVHGGGGHALFGGRSFLGK